MSTQNIVIVGGGGAGVSLAVTLAAQLPKVSTGYRVVLLTKRECYAHLLAMLRLAVNSEAEVDKKALIPYDQILPGDVGSYKIGEVTKIVRGSSAGAGGDVELTVQDRDGNDRVESIPYK